MAELLAVQLHIPIHPDVSTSRSKYQKSASGGSTPSNNSSRFEQFAHLPSRRAVDIEYRDLTYRVREGRHKGLYKMFKTSQPNQCFNNFQNMFLKLVNENVFKDKS